MCLQRFQACWVIYTVSKLMTTRSQTNQARTKTI